MRTAVVCDDDYTMTRIVRHVLVKQGFEVHEAHNGEEGLQLIRSKKPQLVILDIEMPLKDGVEVLAQMRLEELNPYTIVMSNLEKGEKPSQAKALGADEVLVKPFHPADFLKKIEGLLAQGRI